MIHIKYMEIIYNSDNSIMCDQRFLFDPINAAHNNIKS